ncbi:hypothetical protein [Tahibacter amnicola]|uniref:Uncharacterized protein n=1 Tax=Tahibacter amnicola TaxID=2976241 RepID=A0ABY6B818_9GAMM|nr:hypothetical protein [Tahibacter amnicola]UXI66231.1 hypothetical protein N4264_15900 [Tahibacter amnicola]
MATANSGSPRHFRPGWFAWSASALWLLFCGLLLSDAHVGFEAFLGALVFGLVWIITWLARLGWSVYARWKGIHGVRRPMPGVANWLLEPLVAGIGLLLVHTDTLALARFGLSEPALSAYVRDVRQGTIPFDPDRDHPPRWVGLYRVYHTDHLPDSTVRILTSGANLLDNGGLACAKAGEPGGTGEDFYAKRFPGCWYGYVQSW